MGSGKGDVQKEVNNEQKRVNEQYGTIYSDMEEKRRAIEQRNAGERQFLTDTLNPLVGTSGGLDPTVTNNIRNTYAGKTVGFDNVGGTSGGNSDSGSGSSGGSSGGSSPVANPFGEPEGIYRTLGQTGGIEIDKMRAQIAELEAMAKSGGIAPESAASIQDTINKLKNFQFNPQSAAAIQGTITELQNMGRTGGYDPERLAQLRANIDQLRTYASTGGMDADRLATQRRGIDFLSGGGISDPDLARFRGTGFSEFAETGGWSPEQRLNYRDRATSVIPALAQQQNAEAARLNNIQGGGGAGFLAAASRLNRQGSQNLATASRDAEIDLANNINEGRRYGITGLRDTEAQIQTIQGQNRAAGVNAGNTLELGLGANRIQGLSEANRSDTTLEQNIAANRIGATEVAGKLQLDFENSVNDARLRAQQGAGTLESNLADAVAKNRIAAQSAATTAEQTAQRLRQEGQIAGAQGLMQVAAQKEAAARAAQGAANAARAQDQANERWWAQHISGNERWIGEQQMQGQQNALRNLTQIYGMDPDLGRDAFTAGIANDWAGANRGLLGIDAQMASGGKGWQDWAQFGLGTAANMFGGGSKVTGGRPDSTNPSGQNINNFGSDDIGGAIDTGPGSGIWDVPDNGGTPQGPGEYPSDDAWWYGR